MERTDELDSAIETNQRIFVSHASEDSGFCVRYVNELKAVGLDVWYDENDLGPDQIDAVIDEELKRRDVLVIVLSPPALRSPYVREEWQTFNALRRDDEAVGRKRLLVQIVIEPIDKTDIWPRLRMYPRIDQKQRAEPRMCMPVGLDEAVRRTLEFLKMPPPTSPGEALARRTDDAEAGDGGPDGRSGLDVPAVLAQAQRALDAGHVEEAKGVLAEAMALLDQHAPAAGELQRIEEGARAAGTPAVGVPLAATDSDGEEGEDPSQPGDLQAEDTSGVEQPTLEQLLLTERMERLLKRAEEEEKAHPTSAAGWRAKGDELSGKQQFAEAIEAYDRALELEPENGGVLRSKGIALANSDHLDQALAAYDAAIAADAGDYRAWTLKAMALRRDPARLAEAQGACDRALEINPKLAMAWDTKGDIYRQQDQPDNALDAYEQAIRVNPRLVIAIKDKADLLRELKKYDEAVAAYDEALAIEPNNADVLNAKGIALRLMERYDVALEAHDAALQLLPENADLWNSKGLTLRAMKRYDDALAAFDQAVGIVAGHSLAWSNKGDTLQQMRRPGEAVAAYQRAANLQPGNARALGDLANAYRRAERYDEALEALNEALLANGRYLWAWQQKADVLDEMRRWADALAAVQQAIEIDPSSAYTWIEKGYVEAHIGNTKEALESAERVLQAAPDNALGWEGKAYILGKAGRAADGLLYVDQALKQDADDADCWNTKGHLLKDLERFDEAFACMDQVERVEPDSDRADEGRGEIFLAMGRYEDAIAAFDRCLAARASSSAWRHKGDALRELGRYEESDEAYGQALAKNRYACEAWLGRALMYEAQGKLVEASETLDRALAIDPEYGDAKALRNKLTSRPGPLSNSAEPVPVRAPVAPATVETTDASENPVASTAPTEPTLRTAEVPLPHSLEVTPTRGIFGMFKRRTS